MQTSLPFSSAARVPPPTRILPTSFSSHNNSLTALPFFLTNHFTHHTLPTTLIATSPIAYADFSFLEHSYRYRYCTIATNTMAKLSRPGKKHRDRRYAETLDNGESSSTGANTLDKGRERQDSPQLETMDNGEGDFTGDGMKDGKGKGEERQEKLCTETGDASEGTSASGVVADGKGKGK
jgi:hypothetical protein